MFVQKPDGTLIHRKTGKVLEALSPFQLMECIRTMHSKMETLQRLSDAVTVLRQVDTDMLPSQTRSPLGMPGRRTNLVYSEENVKAYNLQMYPQA